MSFRLSILGLVLATTLLNLCLSSPSEASSISQAAQQQQQAQSAIKQVAPSASFKQQVATTYLPAANQQQVQSGPKTPDSENVQQPQQALNEHSQYAGTKRLHAHGSEPAPLSSAKKRSDVLDEDQLPLATVNNHSNRGNSVDSLNNSQMSQLRPPQYVDVSALVGQRNASVSSGSFSQSASSLLSPKSRSGLPECATQQVCNAIFVRMNYTQRLCECSSNYNWKCSNNLDPQDGHTIELTRKFDKRIYTQIKTCEPLREVRACKSPTDWTLLALQSERSGKAHYVVVCKCPTWAQLEGPYTHNHPPYANIPGIRVYGMLCSHQTARSSSAQTYSAYNPALGIYPDFPWSEALSVLNTTNMASGPDSH